MRLFEDIYADKRSGSGTILKKIIKELRNLAENNVSVDREEFRESLDLLASQLPYFGLVVHLTGALKSRFYNSAPEPESLLAFIEEYEQKWGGAQSKASKKLMGKVGFREKNVLLHSNSSAIHNLFIHLKEAGVICKIIQTYSSPDGEGVDQAEHLASLGFPITLIHEDAISNSAERIDLAVFGSDLVRENTFLNKTGTFPLSLMMQYYDKPVYVLSETRKQLSDQKKSEDDNILLSRSDTDLYTGNHPLIEAGDNLFEWTPLKLVRRLFTEQS